MNVKYSHKIDSTVFVMNNDSVERCKVEGVGITIRGTNVESELFERINYKLSTLDGSYKGSEVMKYSENVFKTKKALLESY